MRHIVRILVFVALTALTQIGGVAYLLALAASSLFKLRGASSALWRTGLFLAIYTGASILVLPSLAALGGRVPLPCLGGTLRAAPALCVLNRTYVDQRLADLANALANDVARQHPGTITIALDGNFPLLVGFPLLPHLSHDDGLKLDLAYYYETSDGAYLPGALRSPIGYWAFEQPKAGEETECPATWLTARWSMTALQPIFPPLQLDQARTRAALTWLFTKGRTYGVERVFIEPYLARRLRVASPLLGFQGCRAARHDDHIHLQIQASNR